MDVTNGCIVYQEQVMQLVKKLAGFSTALADNVRYAMSKKKTQMMEDLGKLFVYGGTWTNGETVPGCVKNGIPENIALEIYKQLNDFSQYAFNKSHATCYAYVTYQTAWLKNYYPVEFICALLNNRINDIAQIKKYMEYAKSQGISVLPPCINKSRDEFRVENGAIRFGLGGIRNIGVGIVKQIVDERQAHGEFTDMSDFFERCSAFLNKRMVENLIKGGAFDCFNRTRNDMLKHYVEELNDVLERNKMHETGQMSIFDMLPELKTSSVTNRVQEKELPKQVLYTYENEVLGLYMTGSPLDEYDEISRKFRFDFSTKETTPYPSDDNSEEMITPVVNKRFVTTGGILRDIRVVVGKDNNRMAFGVLEDKFGTIEVALYAQGYEKFKNLFAADAFVVIKGSLGESREGYKITIREIIAPKTDKTEEQQQAYQQEEVRNVTLWLKMEKRNDETFNSVVELLQQYPGNVPVRIKIEGKALAQESQVRQCSGLEYELGLLLGDSNVIFFEK
ncbi:MAG: hypothetical protein IJF66_05245 [Clostridia bacterium]|nr:hypothetical protein [Clostridia bacterium]